jgi:DNA-binding transcriptional LysR family regulator
MKTIREFKGGQGIQRLSVCSLPSNQVSKGISEFYRDFDDKNFQMEFWEDNVEELITRIHKRKSELGFVYLSYKNLSAFMNHIKMKGLQFCELGKYQLYLYAGKDNPISKFPSINEKMLAKIKLVQYNEKQYSLYSHLGHLKEDIIYGGEDAEIAYTNSDQFVCQLLQNTEYCSISSSFIKSKYEEEGIVAIPIEPMKPSVSFGYIKRSKDNLSELEQSFLEYLISHYIDLKDNK